MSRLDTSNAVKGSAKLKLLSQKHSSTGRPVAGRQRARLPSGRRDAHMVTGGQLSS